MYTLAVSCQRASVETQVHPPRLSAQRRVDRDKFLCRDDDDTYQVIVWLPKRDTSRYLYPIAYIP